MATTYVSIANLALVKLGQDTINLLTEENARARAINAVYEHVRDGLLREHRWNFAMSRAELTQNATDPLFGWGKSFALPGDFIRMIRMEALGTDYRVEGGNLITDASTSKIVYVKQVTDPNLFDSSFIYAYAYRLAADVAVTLTGDAQKAQGMEQLYRDVMAEAKYIDAVEKSVVELEPMEFIESRVSAEPYRKISS